MSNTFYVHPCRDFSSMTSTHSQSARGTQSAWREAAQNAALSIFIARGREGGREREGTKERKGLLLLLRRHFFDLLKPARPLTPSLATILWRRSMRECETAVITACMHGQARRRRGPTPLDGSGASSAPGCPAHPSDGVAPAPATGWRNGPNALYASHFWPLFRPSVRPPLPSENVITRAFDALSFIALRRGRQACIHSYAHTQAKKPTISF